MNVKDGVRWKTVRTNEELSRQVSTKRGGLSTDELDMVLRLLTETTAKRAEAFSILNNLEYEETPVPPEQFLEDPYYFGEIGKDLYPWIKRDIPRFFKEGFEQAVLTGAQRTGKDTFAHCALAYLIYLIQCMHDPAVSYGLAKGSNLYIVLMSATQELAKEVVFGQLVEKMKQSPWFSKLKRKEMSDEIRFGKGLILKGAESGDTGIVGLNTCAVVVDEANLGRKMKAVHETRGGRDRMETIYNAIRRRVKTTFFRQGIPPTLLFVIGSRRYPSDFVDRRITQLASDEKALIVDLSLWEAKGKENFSDKYFRVMVGNEATPSRILIEGEKVPDGMKVVEVPEDFKADFETDCDGALRDIGGVSVRTVMPFFTDQSCIQGMIDESRKHPCDVVEWKANTPMCIDWDQLVQVKNGRVTPILSPDKARCVAIDLGRVRNPTGFTVGHVRGFKTVDKKSPDGILCQENQPIVVVDFVLRITPGPGEEVRFSQVRELVFQFIQQGIPIKYAVFDHWQCLTGDTRVVLLNGREIPIRDLERMYPNGSTFWVYSYDTQKRKVVPGKAKAVGKTGTKVPVVEVALDSGEKVRCTSNHRFMLLDGSYRQAGDLKAGDSLMALYRKTSKRNPDAMSGYEMFRRPGTFDVEGNLPPGRTWQYTHRMVAETLEGFRTGIHIHHRFGKRNNFPDSLEVKDPYEHFKNHGYEFGGDGFRTMWSRYQSDPEFHRDYKKFLQENVKRSANNPEAMGRKKEWLKRNAPRMAKKMWSNPVYVEKMKAIFSKRNETYKMDGHPQWMGIPLARIIEVSSRSKSICAAARELGIARGTLYKRLLYFGYTPQRFYAEILNKSYYRHHNPKAVVNHKVVSVKEAGFEDVYDITVEGYSNFLVTAGSEFLWKGVNSGIFVHNSDDFAQLLTDQGVETVQIKTDVKAYDVLKAAIYEGRVKTYKYRPLIHELSMLEYDAKKQKVDTSSEDFGPIHHDVADSVCLLVNSLSQNFRPGDFDPVLPESNLTDRRGSRMQYMKVGPGETPFENSPGYGNESQSLPPPSGSGGGLDGASGSAYGFVFDDKEAGWAQKQVPPDARFVATGAGNVVRVEVLAQDFCRRAGVDKVPSVSLDSIKAFLFESGLTDSRYLGAIRRFVEEVHGKTVK